MTLRVTPRQLSVIKALVVWRTADELKADTKAGNIANTLRALARQGFVVHVASTGGRFDLFSGYWELTDKGKLLRKQIT